MKSSRVLHVGMRCFCSCSQGWLAGFCLRDRGVLASLHAHAVQLWCMDRQVVFFGYMIASFSHAKPLDGVTLTWRRHASWDDPKFSLFLTKVAQSNQGITSKSRATFSLRKHAMRPCGSYSMVWEHVEITAARDCWSENITEYRWKKCSSHRPILTAITDPKCAQSFFFFF